MTEYDATVKAAKETFSKRIKTALEDKGCDTLVKKAELLGVTDDQIRNYEKGRSFPPTGQLVYFARCLGCSVDYLTDESVTVKTPDTDVKSVSQATGLSEESAKLLVTMKKSFRQQLAALDALLFSCLHYDRETKQYQYNPLHGVITSNAEYFRIVNETWLHSEEIMIEDTVERNNARMCMMDSTMNLLEDRDKAHQLCEFYRKNLERLELEQKQKGGSDNGSGNE